MGSLDSFLKSDKRILSLHICSLSQFLPISYELSAENSITNLTLMQRPEVEMKERKVPFIN